MYAKLEKIKIGENWFVLAYILDQTKPNSGILLHWINLCINENQFKKSILSYRYIWGKNTENSLIERTLNNSIIAGHILQSKSRKIRDSQVSRILVGYQACIVTYQLKMFSTNLILAQHSRKLASKYIPIDRYTVVESINTWYL